MSRKFRDELNFVYLCKKVIIKSFKCGFMKTMILFARVMR